MLSAGALRMYAWISLIDSGYDATQLVSQIRNKRDRYAALRELEAAGILLVHRERGKANTFQLRFHSISNNKYISYISGSDIEATSVGEPLPPSRGEPLPVEENLYTRIPSPVEESLYGYDSLDDEADDIDSMPDDGRDTPAKAHTPFRARRERQRKFVQRTWGEIYPNLPPLIDANANEFLKLCDDSASEVLAIFQKFQGSSKACFAYLRAVARNQHAKRTEQAQPPEGTISAASGSVNFPGWDSDEAYYEHQRKTQESLEWLRQNGISDDD